jgi:hypothetical protein
MASYLMRIEPTLPSLSSQRADYRNEDFNIRDTKAIGDRGLSCDL